MLKKINELVTIISGYTFRGALIPDMKGNTSVLQAKNIKSKENIFDTTNLTKIAFTTFRSNAYLQENDILLVSRGLGAGTFRSTVFKCSEQNVIASSSVYILRVNSDTLLPDFLSLYLNSNAGQNAITQIVSGSHFQTILRKNLETLEIPVPSIEKQKLMVALYKNIHRQETISNMKNSIRYNLYNSIFKKLTYGN